MQKQKTSQNKQNFLEHPKPLLSLSIIELWERFAFYGTRSLLVLFMVATIGKGGLEIDAEEASAIYGIFAGCLYLAALPGGWLTDNYLGQKRAILLGLIIISLGYISIALSIFYTFMFFIGLIFIVIGTGLFKTSVSVTVGMLYKKDDARLDSGFTIFYMTINIGAFMAPLICGFIQANWGYYLGFGVSGLGILISLIVFYSKTLKDLNELSEEAILQKCDRSFQKNKKIIPVFIIGLLFIIGFAFLIFKGVVDFDPVSFSKKMLFIVLLCVSLYFIYLFTTHIKERKKLTILAIFFFSAVFFWAAFEQKPTAYNLFAQDFTERNIFNWKIPTNWFQSFNPLFVIILAPVISLIWIKLANKKIFISSIFKFGLGIFFAGIGFMFMKFASLMLISNNGLPISPIWIITSIFFLTLGELCISPIGLSVMTKIAPNAIKNQIMGFWFVAGALGNLIGGLIGGNVNIENIEKLPNIFEECMWVLLIVAFLLFIFKKPIEKITNN